jgi:hypothetical protein
MLFYSIYQILILGFQSITFDSHSLAFIVSARRLLLVSFVYYHMLFALAKQL